jgi:multidrug efflux system membrane fusion protein
MHQPASPPATLAKKKSRRYLGRGVALLVIVGVVAAIVYGAQNHQRNAAGRLRGNDGPVPVLVTPARTADVPVYFDGVGTIRALNSVTVRPQIDGKLVSVNFKEGQEVERGYVLAELDPTIYQAQYDQALAKKGQDEAQLANARRDLERYERLARTNSITQQQADTQKSLVAQLEAQIRADQAAAENAKGFLDYTKITAPFAGRTGIRQVDVGNVVHPTDQSGIVIITQLRPISVLFTLPQQQLGRVNKAFAQGPLAVEALGDDGRSIVDRGTLQVVDNQVDPTTGTVRLKAEFPNPELQLWPGQFVNVRLLVDTMKNAVVVPTAAIQRGPNGTFVFVAREGDTVSVRNVTVAQQDESEAVVASGLQPGESVVTSGFARLAEGSHIRIGTAEPGEAPKAGEGARGRKPEGAAQPGQPPRPGERRRRTEGGTAGATP